MVGGTFNFPSFYKMPRKDFNISFNTMVCKYEKRQRKMITKKVLFIKEGANEDILPFTFASFCLATKSHFLKLNCP